MSSKGNTNHIRLMNKLKMVEKYKNDNLHLAVGTWSFKSRDDETQVKLWSGHTGEYIFIGTTISELERFINGERERAGLFKPRGARHKESIEEVLNESKSG